MRAGLELCICIQGCFGIAKQHWSVCTAARQAAQNGLYLLWRWDKVVVSTVGKKMRPFSLLNLLLTLWLVLLCGLLTGSLQRPKKRKEQRENESSNKTMPIQLKKNPADFWHFLYTPHHLATLPCFFILFLCNANQHIFWHFVYITTDKIRWNRTVTK